MAEQELAAAPAMAGLDSDRLHWILRRLHSLSGIVPIGFFLFFHLFENSYVTKGGDVWWKETEFTRTLPFQVGVEAVMLWIPILYHAVYGLIITVTAEPNVSTYTYTRNYQYTLQRITGVFAFLFIGYHVLSTRAWFYFTGVETTFATMHATMMNPLLLTIYIVGTLSCIYHLCNGIFTFCITWGITVGPKAQTLVNYACIALFIVLAIVGVDILISFRA
ncbi:MAG: succinate dehydrogenase [Candidatus Binataceae bacterium]|jgi:succinate dehydrogenase / fumarate reductase cytochrome b subunit